MRHCFKFACFDPISQSKYDIKPSSCQRMMILRQAHSDIVIFDRFDGEIEGDAAITTQKNTACMVLTADCVPILVYEGEKVAAIHAGWRGLANGIIQNTLAHFSHRAKAIIGPCISMESYEVGGEVVEHFREYIRGYRDIGGGKFLLSPASIAREIIESFGITAISEHQLCTYATASLPSYRRDATRLRLVSMIWRI